MFPFLSIHENVRPDWLTDQDGRRLELDILIDGLNIAIEVQGVQHFSFVEHFHGDADGYEDQKDRDSAKRAACEAQGVRLIEIEEESQLRALVDIVTQALVPVPVTSRPAAGRIIKGDYTKKDWLKTLQVLNHAINRAFEAGVCSTITVDVRIRRDTGEVRMSCSDPLQPLDAWLGLKKI